jgi:type VI secretion system secreted protein Hcp
MPLDGFFDLDGKQKVSGESLDDKYHDRIEINSFEFGGDDTELDKLLDPGEGLKKKGYPAPFGFTIEKEIDTASPDLFVAYCQSFAAKEVSQIPAFTSAKLTLRKAGGTEPLKFFKMEFKKVYVTGYTLSTNEDGKSKEKVDFRFVACSMWYQPQQATGTGMGSPRSVGWDFWRRGRWSM